MVGSNSERSQLGRVGGASRALDYSVRRIGDVVLKWLQRRRERRHLEMLDDHMLKDIGVTRADVEREVSKPFWQV